MLQLQTNSVDICRISKLLVKYNIRASIANQVITLDGDVSDEMLTQLCESISINAVQNFLSEEPLYVPKKTETIESDKTIQNKPVEDFSIVRDIPQKTITLSRNISDYNLLYPEVKRGEVYLCDLGEPYGSEQGKMRFVIVIQNDDGNLHSPTTIVIACTTEHKKSLPVHLNCIFSSENMIDYDLARVGRVENVILAEQIQTVDKKRLRKYIGILKPDFMQKLQEKIDISLDLSRETKTIVKKEQVYIEKPVYSKQVFEQTAAPKERKDVNATQIQLLSLVDINELISISQSLTTDEVKTQKILELFGFDFKKNGVQYLFKAIIVSPKGAYFNLETLSDYVSKIEGVEKEEIKRLIVARVKETLRFKKAPTIDFIRLVNSFLVKQEA